MDVRLPNGTVLSNVPEGTTQADIINRLRAGGYDPAELGLQEPSDRFPTLRAAADVPVSFGRGVVTGIKMISDAFGADSAASQALQSADTYLADLMSAQSKKDSAEISRIMREAQDKGVYEQVKAGIKALSVAPVDVLTNALGTAAPTIVAGLVAAAAAPEIAGATLAARAVQAGVGAVSGAGTVKSAIYSDVKSSLLEQGVPEDQAEQAAQEAQSYNGKNLDSILGGTILGAIASSTGLEKTAARSLASRILNKAISKEAATEAAETGAVTFAKGFAKESATEAAQAGQEQLAANIAAQREGVDVPTMRGVAGAATLEGLAGGILGGGVDVMARPSTAPKTSEDEDLLEAIRLLNQQNQIEGNSPLLLLEDQTGNRLLDFAQEQREKIPSLGVILDSNTPRDIKIELLRSKIGEQFEFVPNAPVSATGQLALPEVEQGSVRPHEAYNMLVESGAPLSDLGFEQTPGGNVRLLSGDQNVLTAPIRFTSEREKTLFVEALRRENDMRQQVDYQDLSESYKAKQRGFLTETLAAAAREVNTPLYPVTLEEVGKIDPDLVQKVRVSRQMEGSSNVDAPATIDELRQRGASRDTITTLALDQKPITGGGDTIRQEYIEENLGPRPSEPTPTAMTEEQLGRLELPEVTLGEEMRRKTKKKKTTEGVAPEQPAAPVEPGFQRRAERPKYPEIPAAERPDPQAVERARALIDERISRVRGEKEQGKILADALRKALDSMEFSPEQMVAAFNAADVTARLLGKTEVDPHTFEFLGRVFSGSTEAFAKRVPPSETVRGLIQFALDKRAVGQRGEAGRTAAHEAFHVLQDIFAKYDPQGSRIIKAAFKGAKSLDEISPSLLAALKRIKDPDTGASIYDTMQDQVPQEVFDALGDNQAQRERELQAYVFEYLDNAASKEVNVTSIGGAFVRLLNFIRNFKERFGNLIRGQGFTSVEDVLRQVSRGERQAGIGEAGVRVKKDTGGEELKRAAEQTGENVEEFQKWFGNSKAVDENGQPARWYSGTHGLDEKGQPFKKFGKAASGAIPGRKGPFFFSKNPRFAQEFATRNLSKFEGKGQKPSVEAGRMIPAFLSVQNPFDYDNAEHVSRILKDPDVRYLVDRGSVFPAMLRNGDWITLERGAIQNAIRKAGFDGFFVKERLDRTYKDENGITQYLRSDMEEKNLAVYDPKQIKGVFNQFAPGTADQEEFSIAIKRTGQGGLAKVNSDRFRSIWDSIREFFSPFALIDKLEDLFQLRNLSVGTTAKSEEFARQMSDIISSGSDKDKKAVYEYLTTRNASPDKILDKKVRDAAIQTKKEINSIARRLLDQGQLNQESFDKYYDQYLPRLYMVNVLNGKGLKTPLGGKSVQEYLYERNNDLTEEERAIMGEIKDPAFLAYVAISRPSRDLAMIDYLNGIFSVGEENGWIAPQSTVTWRGKEMTPYSLKQKADDMLEVVDKVRKQDPKQAAIMEKEILDMYRIADDGMKAIKANMSVYELEGFKQMPIHPRYTVLSGAVIRTPIYNDLVGTFIPMGKTNASLMQRLFADENSRLVQLTQLWKLGKTTLNPPTVFTNMISNGIALNLFGGVPLSKFPSLLNKALVEMRDKGKNWEDAQSLGLQGGTMASAELNAAINRLRLYQLRSGNDTSLIGMFARIRTVASAFTEKSAELYQLAETLFKFMKYIHDIEQAGPNPTIKQKSNAVNAANEALFDYTLVNPNIRWLRQAPIGLPFITYYYKALPKLVETAVKTPWRFAPYVALAYALPMATMAAFDIDEDELEKLRKSMAGYIRDNGSLYILPYRDEKGNIQYIDAGRFFPFSTFVDPIITAVKYGEMKKGAKEFAQPFIPSGPMVTAITALNAGVDPFTQKKIYDDRDTPKAQALSILSYVWNQALPPALNIDLNNPDNSAGALPRIYNELFVDKTGVDRRGLPKPETAETIARLFGFNITPLDATRQRALNIMYMQNKIGQSRALIAQIKKDQSMSVEDRRARILEIFDDIKKDTEELRKYVADTAGVEQVAQKIRKAQ